MIQSERIHNLNELSETSGQYVLYWMQASQRAHYNHALEHAVDIANRLKRPLVAIFGITEKYPSANLRHYHFMLQGLKDTRQRLVDRGIQLVIRKRSPELAAAEFSKNACVVVTDCGYQRIQQQWREYVADKAPCRVLEVETDVVVPVRQAAQKEQFTAGHFRPKITAQLKKYLVPLIERPLVHSSLKMKFESFDVSDTARALRKLKIDRSVPPSPDFSGGTSAALERLDVFIKQKLARFALCRNDPNKDCLSNMSPYLHFGQISPLYLALEVGKRKTLGTGAFLEELIVRRELAINFVHFNKNYDNFDGLPEWARTTLAEHKKDKRYITFNLEQLEFGLTDDPYWNACQWQMIYTGKMHGYMRMYWGKKILEWTRDPRRAHEIAVYLNDKYELDGREPNGYAGVAWCFGKHDRLWQKRPIFGKVRYMNAAGLKRKFKADDFVQKMQQLKNERGG